MSGPPRVRSLNVAVGDAEARPVLVPAGNKVRPVDGRKPVKKSPPETEKKPVAHSAPQCVSAPAAIWRRQDRHQAVLKSLSSMNASCSSDASSTDSSTHSSGASSSGKMARRVSLPLRKKQSGPKVSSDNVAVPDDADSSDSLEGKKRCAWVTPNTEPFYVAFHDEEWGVPVHDDRKLFELLSFSGALAELTWPTILSKRQLFREVFLDFDPSAVAKMNEKKIVAPGSPANSLLSELRLRSIIENARQMCKVIEEFGSFDTFIWNSVNHKSIVSQFRYPRQVPVKSPKAEVISKDLVRRGFRSVGPTVIYTFMQVAGLTNDHLISCFRFKECISNAEAMSKEISLNSKVKEKATEAVNKLSFTSK
ncbi:guaA, partial [Mucuna pruriens]